MEIDATELTKVEVMALYGYAYTKLAPLSYKERGKSEKEITEIIRSKTKIDDGKVLYLFDVINQDHKRLVLKLDAIKQEWYISPERTFHED